MNGIITGMVMCVSCWAPLEDYCILEIEKSWTKIMEVNAADHAWDIKYYYQLGRRDAFYDILEHFGPQSRQINPDPYDQNYEKD